ncbi:MAG: extracellular solute-binding protein [Alphaproteobacteria bacterium]|nr:MAG: extracellular solute-binding protein [Alphaproteobacteria bacterium]
MYRINQTGYNQAMKTFFPPLKTPIIFVLSALMALLGGCSEPHQNTLHLYNWSQSYPPDLIKKFERETGIRVIYDNFENNDTLEAKLLLGIAGYDIVFPSAWPYFSRQAKAGIYQKLDTAKLPFLQDLDSQIVHLLTDGKKNLTYGIPYVWGVIIFAFNTEKMAAFKDLPLDSYAAVYEPKNIKRLATCGVSFPDEALDIFPQIMRYLKTKDIDKAFERFVQLRPYIRKFELLQSLQDLASGSLCFSQTTLSGTHKMRRDMITAGSPINIDLRYPKEGIPIWMDVLAIPKNAPHVDNAYRFINFIYRPENMAHISNYLYEFNARKGSEKYFNADMENLQKEISTHKKNLVKITISDRDHVRALSQAMERIIFTPTASD